MPSMQAYELAYAGKVRELWVHPERPDEILLVATDRISAFDHILDTPIPDKGEVLTRMSLWWFDQLADLVPHHVVSTDVPDEVAGRAVRVRRLRMLPVECVARAYLTGGGLTEYRATGSVSGIALPEGLDEASRLPEPIFTPSTKAPQGEHDQPIAYDDVVALVGEPLAARLAELTVAVLARGNAVAAERGIVIADTKVEFGAAGVPLDGEVDWTSVSPDQLVLADEVLTPDSSRFWPAEEWEPGRVQASFDKQYVRNWLLSPDAGWDRAGDAVPPALPDDVVAATRARYVEAYERLTGESFR